MDDYRKFSLVLDEDVFFIIKNLSGEELTIYDIAVGDYVGICKSENGKIVKLKKTLHSANRQKNL